MYLGGKVMKTKLLSLLFVPFLLVTSCGSKPSIEVKEREIQYSDDF